MFILGIDPGESTGLALCSFSGALIKTHTVKTLDYIAGFLEYKNLSQVVIEDFIGSGPRSREAIQVLKLIGAIEGICFIKKLPLAIQAPQQRKPYLAKARVLAEQQSKSLHEIDAIAHVLAYLDRIERGK